MFRQCKGVQGVKWGKITDEHRCNQPQHHCDQRRRRLQPQPITSITNITNPFRLEAQLPLRRGHPFFSLRWTFWHIHCRDDIMAKCVPGSGTSTKMSPSADRELDLSAAQASRESSFESRWQWPLDAAAHQSNCSMETSTIARRQRSQQLAKPPIVLAAAQWPRHWRQKQHLLRRCERPEPSRRGRESVPLAWTTCC